MMQQHQDDPDAPRDLGPPQVRGERDASGRGSVARADEPRADGDEDANGESDPAGGGERLRDDLPRAVDRRPHRIAGDELIDDVLSGEPPHDEHDRADDDETDAERANLRPAAPAGEPDGPDPGKDREDPDEVRDLLEPVGDLLGRIQIVGLEDRDLPGVRRDLGSRDR